MNATQRNRRAQVILHAQAHRAKYISDQEVFYPMEHIEHEMLGNSNFDFVYRSEIWDKGFQVEARVKFFKDNRMRLEISERAAREAACGLPQARFALCHEIGHINLHRSKMRGMVDGASRNLIIGSCPTLHHETQDMENEAHLYGGLLLIPLSQINVDANPMELACHFNAPPQVAKQLRRDVLEVWSTLKKMERDRSNRSN
jgi:hypothetical protein